MGNVTTTDLVAIDNSNTVNSINNNIQKLRDEFDKVVYKDGREELTGDLDANSQRIINLPYAGSNSEPIVLGQVEDAILSAGGSISAEALLRIAGDTARPTSATLAATGGSSLLGFIQSGTGATLRTVQDKARDFKTLKDFGAVGDGVADDTAAIQAALTSSGTIVATKGTYKITSTLTIPSNTTFRGERDAIIQTAVTNISLLLGSTVSNCVVEGIHFKQTAGGATAYVGGVHFYNSAGCIVRNSKLEGMQWAGVFFDGCTRCEAYNNIATAFIGTNQDAADFCLYNACIECKVIDNQCFGGGAHGVLVQDPYAGLIPSKNLIARNNVGQHTAYGIAVYLPGSSGSGDSWNHIKDNHIQDIQGSFVTNRDSGAGIYIVGDWAGSTQVTGNNIKNCCVQTLSRSLAPGGIGINGIPSTVGKVIISNNTITGMTQGDGIIITTSSGGAIVSNNVVRMPSTNNGTGVGGGVMAGTGIFTQGSSNLEFNNNTAINLGSGSAFFQFANGISSSNVIVNGGHFESSAGATFRVAENGGFVTSNLNINNVNARNVGTTNYGFSINNVTGGSLVGCVSYSGSFEGLRISNVTDFSVVSGSHTSGTTPAISIVGTCTRTSVAPNVFFGTTAASLNNVSTGGTVTWRNNTAPVIGQWVVGDTVEQSVPVVGSPKRWRCTVAGSPGTWVSEGNL